MCRSVILIPNISSLLVLGSLCIWFLFSSEIGAITSLALAPLVYGRSGFQQFFLFVYVFLFVIVGRLQLRPKEKLTADTASVQRALLLSIIALFVLQGVGYALFARLAQLPIDASSVVVTERGISSNSLSHMHVSKTGLAALISAVSGSPRFSSGDNGAPFYDLLGPGYSMTTAVMLLIALMLSLFLAVKIRSYPPRWSCLVVFSTSSYLLIKSSIDGGVFSKGVFFHAVFLILHVRSSPRDWHRYLCPKRLIVIAVSAFGVSAAAQVVMEVVGCSVYGSFEAGLVVAFLGCLTPLAYYFLVGAVAGFVETRRCKINGLVRVVVGSVGVVCLVTISRTYTDEYRYLNQVVPAGLVARYFSFSEPLRLQEYTTSQDVRVRELLRTLRLRPGIKTLEIMPSQQCFKSSEMVTFDLRVLRGHLDSSRSLPDWLSMTITECEDDTWCTHQVYATLSPCTPLQSVFHSPTLAALVSRGFEQFLVRNFRYSRGDPEQRTTTSTETRAL